MKVGEEEEEGSGRDGEGFTGLVSIVAREADTLHKGESLLEHCKSEGMREQGNGYTYYDQRAREYMQRGEYVSKSTGYLYGTGLSMSDPHEKWRREEREIVEERRRRRKRRVNGYNSISSASLFSGYITSHNDGRNWSERMDSITRKERDCQWREEHSTMMRSDHPLGADPSIQV